MTHNVLLLRPRFILEVHHLDSADIASYKVLMLPLEGIEPAHLESIKFLVKEYLQGLANATLRLYASASDQDTSSGFVMARLARESAMKQILEC